LYLGRQAVGVYKTQAVVLYVAQAVVGEGVDEQELHLCTAGQLLDLRGWRIVPLLVLIRYVNERKTRTNLISASRT
jgi:hypothetical protein